MKNQFEILDISVDAGIRAFGHDLPELFVNAGLGMYSLITDLTDIQEKKTLDISAQGSSLEGLLVAFLNELVFQFDTHGFVGKNISIEGFQADEPASLQPYELKAVLSGEDFDPDLHKGKLLIKAATYHKLHIEKKDGHYQADIIFDI